MIRSPSPMFVSSLADRWGQGSPGPSRTHHLLPSQHKGKQLVALRQTLRPTETSRVREPGLRVTQELTSQGTLDKEHVARSMGPGLKSGPTSHFNALRASLTPWSLFPPLVTGRPWATHVLLLSSDSGKGEGGPGSNREGWTPPKTIAGGGGGGSITWLCRSICPCRPSRRRPQGPGPGSPWPRP